CPSNSPLTKSDSSLLLAEERYSTYPCLYEAAEFRCHAHERMLEVGCGAACDLPKFAKKPSSSLLDSVRLKKVAGLQRVKIPPGNWLPKPSYRPKCTRLR